MTMWAMSAPWPTTPTGLLALLPSLRGTASAKRFTPSVSAM